MTLRVHISPTPQGIADDNGIGRIVHAQYRLLPHYGIELVTPEQADVIACHIERGALPRVDCLHIHGAYFQDIPHEPYAAWHHEANMRIAASAREALAISAPAPWVGEFLKRDMRITPHIIGHGIDPDAWPIGTPSGYVLWNKNRPNDVCDTEPAETLARAGIPVVSTFGPRDIPALRVIGSQPHDVMKQYIQHASVYLATTPETFGIGTLEAMASGVPILGYDWCGTADLVRNGVDGILVRPGDTNALIRAYADVTANAHTYGRNARERAQQYSWDAAMSAYADLYHEVAEERKRTACGRVAVVVTSHNYGRYLQETFDSIYPDQTSAPDEIIIVDDGSQDMTAQLARGAEEDNTYIRHNYQAMGLSQPPATKVKAIIQEQQGVASARNNGIAATNCDYIICLDADDQLAPEYIATCRAALDADRGLGIAYTGLGIMQPHGGVHPSPFPPSFDWEAQAEPHNPPATCVPTAAMFRRSLWQRSGGYKQVYAPGEDAEFYTRLLSIGATARKVTDDPLIHYRIHDGSASRTKTYKSIDTWHPWMRDGQYPFAAPSRRPVPVRSYAQPLVSVIIPVGPGHAHYLPAALDSLLGQSFRQWEVIVVEDDLSLYEQETYPDGNARDKLLKTYPFIREVFPDHFKGGVWQGSVGPSVARNLGLKAARAPLALFLDADDWLLPGALQAMVRHLTETQAGYVYGDALAYGDGEPILLRAPEYSQTGWWCEGPDRLPLMHHSVTALVPTEIARDVGFDESLRGWEEQFFFADLATRGICGARLDAPVIGYRLESGTVRKRSFDVAQELRRIRAERYQDYIAGGQPMGCCGNGAINYDAAQQALAEITWSGGEVPEGMTLIQYTGRNAGAVNYSMVQGQPLRTKYRFAAVEGLQIVPVYNEDVERLLTLGQFRRYEAPAPAAEERPKAAEPTVATVKKSEATAASDEDAAVVRVSETEPTPIPEKKAQRGRKS